MNAEQEPEPICCPEFDPINWDDKIFEWDNKKFIKESLPSFFYIPIGFGRVMKRVDKKLTMAKAGNPDNMGLSDHVSRWRMNVYIAVDREIPDAENVTLSGKFYSRVYEGPYRDTGKWTKEYKAIAQSKGFDIKKWYMWYTTCPKCAKKYGKNYVVIISELA